MEQKIIRKIKQGEFSVERTLLIISGLNSENQINEYKKKIEIIETDFKKFLEKRDINKNPTNHKNQQYQSAKSLFNYFWEVKPNRYNLDFLLTDVIDNQLSKDKGVGNCLGLTSLYSVLGLRLGLNLSILFSNDHIFNLLGKNVLIDNVKDYGFDIPLIYPYDQKFYLEFQKADFSALISGVYNEKGNVKCDLGDVKGAMEDFDKAIELNPKYVFAYSNRGVAKYYLEDVKGAMEDFDKAIELDPKNADFYNNRRILKRKLRDVNRAMEDRNKVIELNLKVKNFTILE